jgi:hypothetical protein
MRKQSRQGSREVQQRQSKDGSKLRKTGMKDGDFEKMFGKDID